MRLIIAGGRNFEDWDLFEEVMGQFKPDNIEAVLSGHCSTGADKMGERWAKRHGIPVELYPAQWDKYGKKAGFMRNNEMAADADALMAFWDGVSPGTGMMIKLAREQELKVRVCYYNEATGDRIQ